MVARRDFGLLRTGRPILGLLVLTAIAGSWYALAVHQGGEAFVTKQVLQENVLRFVDTERGGRGHEHSLFYLLPALLGGMAPWSLFLPAVALLVARRRRHLAEDDLLFPLVWLLTIFVFYSLSSSKRSVYLLPAYPAAALLLGAWWTRTADGRGASATETRLARGAAYLCAAVLGVVALALAGLAVGLTPVVLLGRILDPRDAANLALLDTIAARARPLLVGSSLALAALAAGTLAALRRHEWSTLFNRIAAGVAAVILVVQVVYHPAVANARTFKPFMARVRATVGNSPLFFYDTFDYGAVYYARRHVTWWHGARGAAAPDPVFLLMLLADWKALPPGTRTGLPVVDRSHGTGPKGDRRLVLVRAGRAGAAALVARTRERKHPRRGAATDAGAVVLAARRHDHANGCNVGGAATECVPRNRAHQVARRVLSPARDRRHRSSVFQEGAKCHRRSQSGHAEHPARAAPDLDRCDPSAPGDHRRRRRRERTQQARHRGRDVGAGGSLSRPRRVLPFGRA